jgi:hypothetical protein
MLHRTHDSDAIYIYIYMLKLIGDDSSPWHVIMMMSWSQHVQSEDLNLHIFIHNPGPYHSTITSHGDINYCHKIYKHVFFHFHKL